MEFVLFLIFTEAVLFAVATLGEVFFLRKKMRVLDRGSVLVPILSNLLVLIFGVIGLYTFALLLALGGIFIYFFLSDWLRNNDLEAVANGINILVFFLLVCLGTWLSILATRMIVTAAAGLHGSKLPRKYTLAASVLSTALFIFGIFLAVLLKGGFTVLRQELGAGPN